MRFWISPRHTLEKITYLRRSSALTKSLTGFNLVRKYNYSLMGQTNISPIFQIFPLYRIVINHIVINYCIINYCY